MVSSKWAVSSAVEHYVDIVGVTGSIPVTPTIITPIVRGEENGASASRKEENYEGKKLAPLVKSAP